MDTAGDFITEYRLSCQSPGGASHLRKTAPFRGLIGMAAPAGILQALHPRRGLAELELVIVNAVSGTFEGQHRKVAVEAGDGVGGVLGVLFLGIEYLPVA